jgi:glycine dehydrogenase (decarboxylating)
MALYATIYMSIMGKEGLKEAAQISYDAAHYLCEQLLNSKRVKLVYDKPFFNEFLVHVEDRDKFFDKAIQQGILPGIKVDDDKLLIAVTEKRSKEEIDTLVGLL